VVSAATASGDLSRFKAGKSDVRDYPTKGAAPSVFSRWHIADSADRFDPCRGSPGQESAAARRNGLVGGVLSRRAWRLRLETRRFFRTLQFLRHGASAHQRHSIERRGLRAQAGYNWQFGPVVTGFEIDFSVTDIKGSNGVSQSLVVPGEGSASSSETLGENVKYLGSARARLGWLPAGNVLLYGTAGLAWERLDRTEDSSQIIQPTGQPGFSTFSSRRSPDDKFGWVAGVGAEMMLGSPNWIGRVEYLHYDFGQVAAASTFTTTTPGSTPEISTAGSQTIDVVRAGVSYKFGEPSNIASVPYAAAPIAAPPSSWAGFYLGAHGGYGWGDSPSSFPLVLLGGTGTVDGTNSKGWVAGGQFGYNWQYTRFVTGFELDLSAADIKGNSNTVAFTISGRPATDAFDVKVKYLGTVRGRLGWLPTDSVLLYGTAGLAWERFEHGFTESETFAVGTTIRRSVVPSDQFGWVAGVGGEVMLGSSNWIGRLEYLHYDFGRINESVNFAVSSPGQNISAVITAGRQTIDVVRAGASYKFGPAGAAVATPAMYAKAPRMLPLQTWAGFYLGAHAGYGWKDNDFSTNFINDAFIGGISSRGWLGGGQAGYNWQYASAVAGLELDGSATGIKGSTPAVTSGIRTLTLSDDVKYLGTARGRLGWTPAGNWLLYGTGGLAWERVHRSILRVSTVPAATSTLANDEPRDHFGWVAGAGVESFIGSSNWVARLEYLHYDFGTVESTNITTSNVPGTPSTTDRGGRQTIETVRAGLSYKFTP
jgi:opacity protein-like surface antigen